MARVHNFSAGPAALPESVLTQIANEMLDYQGCGMSVLEMSHRSSMYQQIIDDAEATLRRLLDIPQNYRVIFLQGGATLQFAGIPMNFMRTGRAGYVVTGNFAKKAWKEAAKYGDAVKLASSEDTDFDRIPALAPVRERADYVINTTGLTLSMLQKRICEIYVDGGTRRDILINVVAFGFKYGIPIDADLVFDVRFLPNPYYVEKLRPLSGMDDEVQEYVLRSDVAQRFLEKLTGMIDFLLPQYAAEGRYALTIGIGCTGGQHRSVAVAKALTDYLAARDANVRLRNRDFPRT